MNYQIPLMNLISRGHLPVKNKIATENFIKNLDNESCGTILENLLFNVDSRDCARKLDSVMECYELKTNVRHQVKESTLNCARDKILTEDIEDFNQQVDNVDNMSKSIIKMVKVGMIGAALISIAKFPPGTVARIMGEIKVKSPEAYEILITQPVLKRILPSEVGFFPRAVASLWTWSRNGLTANDNIYLNKLKKFGKTTALVAAGITTAIIAATIAYRQLFSMEARKCKGLSGKKRTICMCNAVITAAESAKKKSEDMLLNCDSAKDPEECRYKMKVEIRSWMKKIEEQKRKLAKLEAVSVKPYPNERPKPEDTTPVKVGTASDPFGGSSDISQQNEIPSDPFSKNSNPFG